MKRLNSRAFGQRFHGGACAVSFVALFGQTACGDSTADRDQCSPGSQRLCGSDMGACQTGVQVCERGGWGACTGVAPSPEICDQVDNDCDGHVDEGFDVGVACTLPSGCPGRLACAADHNRAECVDAPERRARETCDGVDNDCDGWVDAYRVGSEILSACACDRRVLRLSTLTDSSKLAVTACRVEDGVATLQTQVDCASGGYALCTAEPLDFMAFDTSLGGKMLAEVSFDVESDGPLLAALNLWYEGSTRVPDATPPRKYLPLLKPGDAPGSYVKRFAPDEACFPNWSDYHCHGSRGPADCGSCAPADTCGSGTGTCDVLDFSRPKLEVALEFCSGAAPASVTVRIRELAFLSLGCLLGGAR